MNETTIWTDSFFWVCNIGAIFLIVLAWCYTNHVYNNTKSRQMLNIMPGICTSIGILGTFISICCSLWGYADGGTNLEIEVIIGELIPAFSTSIIGLGFSIGATIWTKNKFSNEDKQYDDSHRNPDLLLQDCAESLLQMKSNTNCIPTSIAMITAKLQNQETTQSVFKDQLERLLNELRQQEEMNRELKKQLNENMAKQTEALQSFITNFVNRMDEVFKQMQTSIDQHVRTFGNEQFEKTTLVLTEINKQMTEASTKLVSSQVEQMTAMAADTTSKLESFNADQMEKIKTLLDNQASQAIAMQEMHQAWETKTVQMQQEQYEKISSHNAESLRQMVDLKEAYAETSKQMLIESQEKNKEMTDMVRNSMLDLVSEIDAKVRTQCNTLNAAMEESVKLLKENYEFIDSKIAQIQSDYEQSTLAYKDAVQNAHDINDSFEKTIVQVDKSVQSLKTTNEGVNRVLAILEERQVNINNLVQKIQEMSSAIVMLQQLEIQLNKLANK